MKYKSFASYCSLFSIAVAMAGAARNADAGVRVGNLSRNYAGSYNQVNALRMGTVAGDSAATATPSRSGLIADAGVKTAVDQTGAVIELPIRVSNADLAKKLGLGQRVGNVDLNTLEKCARIYPDGEFAWDTPTGGRGAGGAQTCIAVVEMRVVNADGKGNEAVVARANVAAGDAIRCNIEDFPEYGYTQDAANVIFPADREPTMDDVVAVMNQEQKQNAGLKIAAGAVIGALGGNIAGKAERGADGLFGTGKDKMKTTAIGALSGAAVMAGGSYAGKVGGDVIVSTGVNAAAGGVMGNMMASGNSVLRIEKCRVSEMEQTCLWGTYVKTKDFQIGGEGGVDSAFYNINTGESVACRGKDKTDCHFARLHNITLDGTSKTLEELKKENFISIKENAGSKFKLNKQKNSIEAGQDDGQNIYLQIASATEEDGVPLRAMVAGVQDKTFGMSSADWDKWRGSNPKTTVWLRDYNGDAYDKVTDDHALENFQPLYVNAEDGGLVDISNKARLKGTLTGAGIGGAMGGFVGYQGAQSDINDRWLSATREYKDSLSGIYCITGKRYLGQYNDMLQIGTLFTDEQ